MGELRSTTLLHVPRTTERNHNGDLEFMRVVFCCVISNLKRGIFLQYQCTITVDARHRNNELGVEFGVEALTQACVYHNGVSSKATPETALVALVEYPIPKAQSARH